MYMYPEPSRAAGREEDAKVAASVTQITGGGRQINIVANRAGFRRLGEVLLELADSPIIPPGLDDYETFLDPGEFLAELSTAGIILWDLAGDDFRPERVVRSLIDPCYCYLLVCLADGELDMPELSRRFRKLLKPFRQRWVYPSPNFLTMINDLLCLELITVRSASSGVEYHRPLPTSSPTVPPRRIRRPLRDLSVRLTSIGKNLADEIASAIAAE